MQLADLPHESDCQWIGGIYKISNFHWFVNFESNSSWQSSLARKLWKARRFYAGILLTSCKCVVYAQFIRSSLFILLLSTGKFLFIFSWIIVSTQKHQSSLIFRMYIYAEIELLHVLWKYWIMLRNYYLRDGLWPDLCYTMCSIH